jgi:hypothetical protein
MINCIPSANCSRNVGNSFTDPRKAKKHNDEKINLFHGLTVIVQLGTNKSYRLNKQSGKGIAIVHASDCGIIILLAESIMCKLIS